MTPTQRSRRVAKLRRDVTGRLLSGGVTPLEVLVTGMRVAWKRSIREKHVGPSFMVALACAEKAAPYMHSKMAPTSEKERLQSGQSFNIIIQPLTLPDGTINQQVLIEDANEADNIIEGEIIQDDDLEADPGEIQAEAVQRDAELTGDELALVISEAEAELAHQTLDAAAKACETERRHKRAARVADQLAKARGLDPAAMRRKLYARAK